MPFESYHTPLCVDDLIEAAISVPSPYHLEGVCSQLHPKAWAEMLTSGSGVDPDIKFVLDGILYGFNVINRKEDIVSYHCENYNTCFVEGNEGKLREIIRSEVSAGKLTESNDIPTCVHSMGVVKKKDSNKIRPITDCSKPKLSSVNHHMSQVYDNFSYIGIDQVLDRIKEGKDSCVYLSTIDLACAYRSVLIRPANRPYFGLKLDGKCYVDNFLCFGTRSAPFIFTRIMESVCRSLRDSSINCYCYLDDIICLSSDFESGICDQLTIITRLRSLGFYIAWSKVKSPSRICTYLGYEIDTLHNEVRLPQERINRLRKELVFWSGKRKATLKQLQVLTGHLIHCASVIKGGNAYMHHIFATLLEANNKRRVKLKDEFHADIWWWFNCASTFNHRPINAVYMECHDMSMFSGYHQIETTMSETISVVQWPCVYLYTDGNEDRIFMFSSEDTVIGYTDELEGLGMYLPNELCFDDVAMEVVSVWMGFTRNPHWHDCIVQVICARKLTYVCLRKLRSRSLMLAVIFKQLYNCLIERNIYLEVTYMPIV